MAWASDNRLDLLFGLSKSNVVNRFHVFNSNRIKNKYNEEK